MLLFFYFYDMLCFFLFSDVNVTAPDKKSVMMYLMCLFKVLPHSDIPTDHNLDIAVSPTTPISPTSISLVGSANIGIQESKVSAVSFSDYIFMSI